MLGPGDSAETIALMYGLPASAIRAANPKSQLQQAEAGHADHHPALSALPAFGAVRQRLYGAECSSSDFDLTVNGLTDCTAGGRDS